MDINTGTSARQWGKFFGLSFASLSVALATIWLPVRLADPGRGSAEIHIPNLQSLAFRSQETLRSFADSLTFGEIKKRDRALELAVPLFQDALAYAAIGDISASNARVAAVRQVLNPHMNDEKVQRLFFAQADKLMIPDLLQVILLSPIHPGLKKTAADLFKKFEKSILLELTLEKSVPENLERMSMLKSFAEANPELLIPAARSYEELVQKHDRYFRKSFLEIIIFFEGHRTDRSQTLDFLHKALKRGKLLMESEKIPFTEGKEALLYVLAELRKEKANFAADNKTIRVVNATIQSFEPFFAFLFSPDAETLSGTFSQKFAVFLEREKETSAIVGIADRSFESAATPSVSILEKAKNDLASLKIQGLVLAVHDKETGTVRTDGTYAGATFSAVYHTYRKIFSNISFNGEAHAQSISLAKFPSFFSALAGKAAVPEERPVLPAPESQHAAKSKVEKVLKAKVMEKMSVLGFAANEDQITVLDATVGHVSLMDANIASPQEASLMVSFDFFNESNEVKNVRFETVTGTLILPDQFGIAQLKNRVQILVERAKLEKEREIPTE